MQTPKLTPKQRSGSSEPPQKVSPRVARPLKLNSAECSSGSPSSLTSKTTKDRSPKVVDRKSPRSPLAAEKKRPSRVSELESQVSQLQGDLKKVKDHLLASESAEKDAQADAQQVKIQLLEVSSKLQESDKQLLDLLAHKESSSHLVDLQNISDGKDRALQCQLEAVQKQQQHHHQGDSDALASALDEIQRLRLQLHTGVESQGAQQGKCIGSNDAELHCLKETLAEAFSFIESMRNELNYCKASEAQAQELVRETLMQLEAAKETVNVLRTDGEKATEAYRCTTSELDESRARIHLLEGLVRKLKIDASSEISEVDEHANNNAALGIIHQDTPGADLHLEAEFATLKSEVGQLRSALQAAEDKYREVEAENNWQMRRANDEADLMKSASHARELELKAELKKAEAGIEELKANLMDKENELQAISEENEVLNKKLEKTASNKRGCELENELKRLRNDVGELRANLMDKETELQNISEENETLKTEMNKKRVTETGGCLSTHGQAAADEIQEARAAERDALTKLGYLMEETDKSHKKAERATEQLEAAHAAYAEMETELRKLKVQSEQWRKAAEAAASMLSPTSNGKFVARTGSLDSGGYSPVKGRMGSPYLEDYDDDAFKKKNGNMLKKIGVLWKKPHK